MKFRTALAPLKNTKDSSKFEENGKSVVITGGNKMTIRKGKTQHKHSYFLESGNISEFLWEIVRVYTCSSKN